MKTLVYVLSIVPLVGACAKDSTAPTPEQGPAQPVQLTTVGGTRPTASPDGQWVAFQVLSGGIARIRPDGTGLETLTSSGVEPEWSRPGSLIVFRDGTDLYTVDASSRQVTVVASGGGIDDDPAWSPAGNEIAVQGSSPDGILIVSYPGGTISSLSCSESDGSSCAGEGPTWAPNGSSLAFEDGVEILRVPRGGGAAAVVVSPAFDVTHPAWSPNGTWIAFVMDDATLTNAHIWVAEASGLNRNARQVTSGMVADYHPAWSPGSGILYFASDRSGQTEIWKVGFTP